MSDMPAVEPNPSLGVGTIVSESFSILFKNFVLVFIVAFIPSLIGLLISGLLIGFEAALGIEEQNVAGGISVLANVVSALIDLVVYSVTTALVIQLAYDAKLSRPIRIGRYFGPALSAIVPLVVLSLVAGILATIGFVILIVPGIWVYAVFAVVAPVVVIERAGFTGLGRSAALTKEYRWPIVGAFILAFLIAIALSAVAILLASLAAGIGGVSGLIIAVMVFTALSTMGTGLISIVTSMIYARLREIKEGVSVDQIAAVFD
ncbi:hypothetical protein [Roseibium aggregatum]|uniref:Glycerophosphoryl diester phosphodiesterase membrane domain-containing protein n=1 Tax=Roseibium aggregatum TaxID=187304 RepID=A0A939EJD3_9HYPH|nr:hypothetical protein [Roseibium aggregatum]MBN9673388.1 hypothetical protein [Roseibium aggregatum]